MSCQHNFVFDFMNEMFVWWFLLRKWIQILPVLLSSRLRNSFFSNGELTFSFMPTEPRLCWLHQTDHHLSLSGIDIRSTWIKMLSGSLHALLMSSVYKPSKSSSPLTPKQAKMPAKGSGEIKPVFLNRLFIISFKRSCLPPEDISFTEESHYWGLWW